MAALVRKLQFFPQSCRPNLLLYFPSIGAVFFLRVRCYACEGLVQVLRERYPGDVNTNYNDGGSSGLVW